MFSLCLKSLQNLPFGSGPVCFSPSCSELKCHQEIKRSRKFLSTSSKPTLLSTVTILIPIMTNFSFCCSRTCPATILSISHPLLLCSPLPGLGEVSWRFHLFVQTPSYITLAAWGSHTAGCHENLMTGFLSYYGVENETVSVICCDISPKVSSRLWGAESLHSIQTNLIFFLFAREKMKCFLSYSVQP